MAGKGVLRGVWFQAHKWIGILLAVLIIPVSLSGSALVWHDWLDETLNPTRFAVTAPASLPLDTYIASARAALAPGERISQLRFGDGGDRPLQVTAARAPTPGQGRPVRTQLWLDPASGRVVDRAGSDEGAMRVLHVLHGSLMVPGVGRQIVGWIGVAMLVSSLTGLWLWWPSIGKWTRGLHWRRERTLETNLHHQTGFWIAIPLAMLSFTGAWISFPAFFGPLSGQVAAASPGPDRAARMRARPLETPALTPGGAIKAARGIGEGRPVAINWPTDVTPEWRVSLKAGDAKPAEIIVADAGGAAKLAPSEPSGGIARTMRRWHDGTGMGLVWQVIIFIGGIIPALLAVTGVIMWLRTRKWRGEVGARRRRVVAAAE